MSTGPHPTPIPELLLNRVSALIAIEPGVPCLGTLRPHWVATAATWEGELEDPTGGGHPSTSTSGVGSARVGEQHLTEAFESRECFDGGVVRNGVGRFELAGSFPARYKFVISSVIPALISRS